MTADRSDASARQPMVSVIVPVFNTSVKFLNECIESVLAQEFSDFELIVVDDGSTDPATVAALDTLADSDPRITLLRRSNGGVSAARNAAIDVARGRYVNFLDSDDRLLPGGLGFLVDLALQTGAPIATAGVIFRTGQSHGDGRPDVLDGHEAIVNVFRQHDYAWNNGVGAKIFERHLFDSVRFSPNRFEDLEIIPTLYLRAGRIAYDPRAAYFYRQHPGSFSAVFSTSRFDVLDVIDRLRATVGGIDPAIDHALDDRTFSAACNIAALLARQDKAGRYHDVRQRVRGLIKRYRRQILLDNHARIKNRLGALTAMAGHRVFELTARLTRI